MTRRKLKNFLILSLSLEAEESHLMRQKTYNLEGMALWIPPLWEQDWDSAIRNSAGVEEILIKIQARAANLLRQINDLEVTFARLGWLNIWTNAFATLEGALCAIPRNSLYLLRILGRTSFEKMLHARTILEPMFQIYREAGNSNQELTPKNQRKGKAESLKRLEAYTAWCIWNDKFLCEQIVEPKTLNRVWDSDPAKRNFGDLTSLKVHETLYGQRKIATDGRELKKGRLRQQDEGQHRLHRIRMWLEHPKLRGWQMKLQKQNLMTFFTLVGETVKGKKGRYIKECLMDLDLSFGYPIYSDGSMAIHGSSMDQFLNFGEKKVIPLFLGSTDEVRAKAEEVAYNCNDVIIALYLLRKQVWPDQGSSDSSDGDDWYKEK
jgi:hypothetical protein